jgi:uroporphyrinogen decarboxylase
MFRKPLTKEETKKAIDRNYPPAAPLVFHKWWGEGLWDKYGNALNEISKDIPDDIFIVGFHGPGGYSSSNSNPSYRFGYRDDYHLLARSGGHDSSNIIPTWDDLNKFAADFPDPYEPGTFDGTKSAIENADKAGDKRYRMGHWWGVFHEKFWGIRGMESLMVDYHEHMDELKVLGRLMLDFHKGVVDRFAELKVDGIFTSDDLGHQTSSMMSPKTFHEFYYPLYKELCDHVHSYGMHFWLHSCGDNTPLMDDLIAAGVDVFHPVQRFTMDERATAKKYGDKISFLAGADVQYLLPESTEEECRKGVREWIDMFYRPEGGLLLAAGNGILPDTPLENIRAMLEEVTIYGTEIYKDNVK